LKFIDPDGLRVVVAADAAVYVRLGYANSATFRAKFDWANKNPAILVFMTMGSDGNLGRSSRSETNWRGKKPPTGQLVTPDGAYYKGVIDVSIRGIGQGRYDAKSPESVAARMGHELDHTLDLAKYGSLDRSPDSIRASGSDPNKLETDSALAAERTIMDELGSSAHQDLSDTDITTVFSATNQWEILTDTQQQECLSNVACMAMSGSGPGPN
jgi:hypothetical protein